MPLLRHRFTRRRIRVTSGRLATIIPMAFGSTDSGDPAMAMVSVGPGSARVASSADALSWGHAASVDAPSPVDAAGFAGN